MKILVNMDGNHPHLVPLDSTDVDVAIDIEIRALSKIQREAQSLLQKTNRMLDRLKSEHESQQETRKVGKGSFSSVPDNKTRKKPDRTQSDRFSTLQNRLLDFLREDSDGGD